MRPLSRRESQIVALALMLLLLGAATAGIYHLLVVPIQESEAQMDELRQRQQRYRQVIGQKERLQARLDAAVLDVGQSDSLLEGDDPGTAQAELMSRLSASVVGTAELGPGCSLLETLPVSRPQAESPYTRVTVNVTLECAMEPLTAVLHDLENGRPFVFIDQLTLQRRSGVPHEGGAGRLSVRMTASGYLRKSIPEQPPGTVGGGQ
ncbi:hypothetical protein L861_14635 [Litchfieldella anticariensis FP35 = DSM 16096]|uniref:General secretion pathway protein M n=2 Tax=Litchfieldella anticariensis TaxID=258591 RepID=S2KIH3_LITA3|nr:hypothetical protein L861_14635 [Halomonas anticariensis FP35 = DSM 16096]